MRLSWLLAPALLLILHNAQLGQCQDSKSSSDDALLYRTGPGVIPPRTLYQPPPDYPTRARNGITEGNVTLGVLVGINGLPEDIKVLRGLSPGFDKEAIEAIKKWKFSPAKKDGKAVPARVTVTVGFRVAH